ncbi:hypothetical protein ACFY94_25425 [Streptomyces griseorubiginosus]|uniref:hypothetical protein n=1 Tax=Streptomyces griseorubiginosus TaxID=67304 RepID=UPI0036E133AC
MKAADDRLALEVLPERQRKHSLVPLLHAYDAPVRPLSGAIEKHVADLKLLALL